MSHGIDFPRFSVRYYLKANQNMSSVCRCRLSVTVSTRSIIAGYGIRLAGLGLGKLFQSSFGDIEYHSIIRSTSGGSRKKYWGGGWPSSFGRQPRLSEITIEAIITKIYARNVAPSSER